MYIINKLFMFILVKSLSTTLINYQLKILSEFIIKFSVTQPAPAVIIFTSF